jgi:subtilase family serine protease
VPALPAGGTHSAERKVTLSPSGDYRAFTFVDVDEIITETNEENNKDTLVFKVSEAPKCDLFIETFTKEPASPTTATEITFTVIVKNDDLGTSSPCNLEIKIEGDANPPQYLVPALDYGETHTATRKETIGTAGNYNAYAYVDIDTKNDESDETNNQSSIEFSVSEAGPPDLEPYNVLYYPTTPTTTTEITFEFHVYNNSPNPAGPSKAAIKINDENSPPTFDVPALDGHDFHKVERKATIGEAGQHNITVIADHGDDVAESDESDNTSSFWMEVVPGR